MAEQPKSSIDYNRRLSLPLGIAPELISLADLPNYLKSLDIDIDLLNNTYSEFFPSSKINKKKFNTLVATDGSIKVILPLKTNLPALPANEITLTDVHIGDVIRTGAKTVKIPAGFDGAQIALELIKKVVYNNNAEQLSSLPVPLTTLDSFRCFWIKDSSLPLANTLGINILDDSDRSFLLPTSSVGGTNVFGELERLIVRAPALSMVRFEPYYHFKWDGAKLTTICQSNSGRLVFKTQLNATASETRLFETSTLAFENIDKKSVYNYMYRLITYQVENFSSFIIKNESNLAKAIKTKATRDQLLAMAGAVPNSFLFEAPKTFYKNLIDGIRKSLTGWVLNKKNKMEIELTDTVTYDQIKAAYAKITSLYESDGKKPVPEKLASVEDILDFITIIKANVAFKDSYYYYLRDFHVPLSLGNSWSQCYLDAELPILVKFPVPDDEPPKNGNDLASKVKIKEQEWIETIYNDKTENNAFVCYSGCPVGNPSKVYHTTKPVAKSKYPAGAMTTFELEASILTKNSIATFPSVTTLPASNAGNPLDLSAFEPFVAGYSCNLQLYDKKFFYTAIDWFQELLKKTNGLGNEDELISLFTTGYFDLLNRNSQHPICYALNYENYYRSLSIRKQFDELNDTTTLQVDQLAWWCNNNVFIPDAGAWPDGSSRAPDDSYRKAVTRNINSAAMHSNKVSSGFDEFDIESAFIARSLIVNPLSALPDYPIALMLNLMEREGVRTFALFNRCIRPKYSFRWMDLLEFWNNAATADIAVFTSSFMGRQQWLRWPYGLDTYNAAQRTPGISVNARFKIVIDLLRDNGRVIGWDATTVQSYIDERCGTSFLPKAPPPPGMSMFSVFKNTKRVHWSFLSFMLGWFAIRHMDIKNKTNISTDTANAFAYNSAKGWMLDNFTAEPNLQIRKKNMITYYSLIYLAYNAGESMWNNIIADVEGRHGATFVRDFLLFKYTTAVAGRFTALSNMYHFAVGLDAMLRIDEMKGALVPIAAPDKSGIATRVVDWGI